MGHLALVSEKDVLERINLPIGGIKVSFKVRRAGIGTATLGLTTLMSVGQDLFVR